MTVNTTSSFLGTKHLKLILILTLSTYSSLSSAVLTIEKARTLAINKDTGISGIMNNAKAMQSEAIASGQLPDPILLLGTQSLPLDTFNLNQEPMTQIKIGIKQAFPQGDTLALNEVKLLTQSDFLEENAKSRQLSISRQVKKIWLDIYYWERITKILVGDRSLFQQLLDVTRSLYSVGTVKQQDVLRAELELSRLKEKIIKSRRNIEVKRASLSRWIGLTDANDVLSNNIPDLILPADLGNLLSLSTDIQHLISQRLQKHPAFQGLGKKIDVADVNVQLSQQDYKPKWGVEVNYGHRSGQNIDGSSRSDFGSFMFNVSLPLLTDKRQDKKLQGAIYRKEAEKNAYTDSLINMVAEVQVTLRRLMETEERLALFNDEILSKARLNAEASLNAYQADASDFAEVMRAYIREENDRIDFQQLQIDRLKLISDLQFYFPEKLEIRGQPTSSVNNLIESDLMNTYGEIQQ